jgi:hypothetical protein
MERVQGVWSVYKMMLPICQVFDKFDRTPISNKYFSTIFHSKLPLNIYFYNKWKDTTSVGVEISQVYNRVKYVTRCQEKKKKRQLRAMVPQLSYVQQCYSVPSGLITWSHKASVIALIVFYQFIYFNHFFVFKSIYIYFRL